MIITVRIPIARNRSNRSLKSPLDDVLQVHRPEDPGAVRDDQGGPALEGNAGDRVLHFRGEPAPGERLDRVRRPLADLPPVHVHAAHPRLRREGDEMGVGHLREVPPPEAELFRQHDDAAPFRRLVGQRGELGGVRQLLDAHPFRRQELRRLPVAQRDRPRLVEEQDVDVPRRLHRATAHGEDVLLDEPVDPGDPDGGEQPSDGGGDEADQKRHQDGDGEGNARIDPEELEGHDHDEEDDRQRGQQDGQGDLVRRLLALRAFHQLDHPIQEALPRVRGDHDLDPVRQDAGSPRDGAAVAARLADHRRGFPRDGGLVHGGHPFDHRPVAGDDLPGGHDHDILFSQLFRRDGFRRAVLSKPVRHRLGAGLAERVGLRLSPPLGHRLGEVGEQHGEPEPDGHLQAEAQRLVRRPEEERDGREERPHLGDEHHGVFHQRPRVQLGKRRGGGLPQDLGLEQGMGFYRHGGFPL